MPFFGTPSGGTPAPPLVLGYRHRQDAASAVWLIVHGLGFRPAGIQVSDADGTPVEGVVAHPDLNTTRITFALPVSGIADLS